jgi:malate dehydrogenase (quinone)
MKHTSHHYDVIIIGAGASGTALLYTLARYTNITNIALIEKYAKPGQVNSKASNNSQTLHVGDIETNYSLEKVRQVQPASMMVAHYANTLPDQTRSKIISTTPKMVLGVGDTDVKTLEQRFTDLKPLFPDMQKLDRSGIAQVEPNIILGRNTNEPVLALYSPHGYAVNFEALSESFVEQAQGFNPSIDLHYTSSVEKIVKTHHGYEIKIKGKKSLFAKIVIVDADSYSLMLAKQLGYGKHYSLIPIAGTFYFSRQLLNGKVYTVQEPKLPFAAVHGDPDMLEPNKTRWGPTARFHPVLESRNFKTSLHYFKSSGLHRWNTWKSFFKILLDPTRFKYLLENMLYELPWVGDHLFIKNVQKIIPSIKRSDVMKAVGFGGMRLQRVDTHTQELQLGEGKIMGDHIIFNMTPSPGASVCLYNAMRDAEHIIQFSNHAFTFDKDHMHHDLIPRTINPAISPSIDTSYVS